MAGFRNWKLIAGTTTAAALVIAILGFTVFNTNVEAQSSPNINPNRPLFPTFCPPNLVQHWDKIHFNLTFTPPRDPNDPNPPTPVTFNDLDIKVRDDPTKVADLKAKVIKFLTTAPPPVIDPPVAGGILIPTGSTVEVEILDVEYAIVCATP
jgi:hypothetical protein